MSRLDRPSVQCDRCKRIEVDLAEMSKFVTLHVNSLDEAPFDLCPRCWKGFVGFLKIGSMITYRERKPE